MRGLNSGRGFTSQGLVGLLLAVSMAILAVGGTWWLSTQPVKAQTTVTLVSNFDQSRNGEFTAESGQKGYGQTFTTGAARGAYLLDTIWVRVEEGNESRFITIEGALYTVLADGSRGSKLFTLSHRGTFEDNNTSKYSFNPPPDKMLQPNTSYMFVLDCLHGCANDNEIEFAKTNSDNTDADSYPDWTIADRAVKASHDWRYNEDVNGALVIEVAGRLANAPYVANNGITVVSEPVAATNTYGRDETIAVQVEFDQVVNVDTTNGVPQIRVSIGDDDNPPRLVDFAYVRGSGGKKLVFEYVVQPGDLDSNGIYIGSDKLELYDGTITSADPSNGRPAVTVHGRGGTYPNHKVDDTLAVPPARLESLDLTGVTLRPGFSPIRTRYSGEATPGATETTVTPTASEGVSVRFLDSDHEELADADPVFAGYQLDLEYGDNALVVEATGKGLITTKYTINIVLDPDARAEVTGISVASTASRNGVYGTGETITFSVDFDAPVRVDLTAGRPKLVVNFGYVSPTLNLFISPRDFAFVRGSGTSTLLFEYVVKSSDVPVAGNFRQRVQRNGLKRDGGDIVDAASGASARLSHGVFTASANHSVHGNQNRQVARLNGLSISNATLDQSFGSNRIIYTGTLSEGATTATVTATPASGSSVTILPADADPDTIGHQVEMPLGDNEITITTTRSGYVPRTYSVTITRHAITGVQAVRVVSDPGTDGNYVTGDRIDAEVELDVQAIVDTSGGFPTLELTIGDSTVEATYSTIDPTGTIATFSYTVTSSDHDQDGISIGAGSISLGGGAIRARNGNADARLSHDALEHQAGHRVNKDPEIVPGGIVVTSTPVAAADTYGAGETIAISVTFDADVVVDIAGGIPTLMMRLWHRGIQASNKDLSYVSRSSADTLVFHYVVQPEDRDNSGFAVSANQLRLNGGTIKHSTTGRDANLLHPQPTGDTLGARKVDGSLRGPRATLATLAVDGAMLVPAFHPDTTGYTAEAPSSVTQVTLTALAALDADPVSAVIDPADADGATAGHQVPVVEGEMVTIQVIKPGAASTTYGVALSRSSARVQSVAISSDPGVDSTYAEGDAITIAVTVTFGSPVAVDTTGGTPYVTIAVGSNDRNAAYTSIDATNRIMTFSYTVVAADDDQDGVSISANSLALNGGTITDSVSSRDAVLTHAALSDQSSHLVNKIPKVVAGGVAITSTPQAKPDTYGLGETIAFSVTFDSVVNVDTTGGTPTLTMGFSEGGGNPVSKTLTYASGSGTAILVFEYVVLIDDVDDDGLAIEANQLALNSGTITHSTTGQGANLTHAQPGTNGVFAEHKVDGTLGAGRATLSALSLTGVTLAPAFDADTTTYVGTATTGTTQTTITATAETGTSITISPADAEDGVDGHQVDVSQGTAITLTASADGKLTSAYTVTISFNAAVQSVAVSSDPGTDATYAEGDAITVAVTFDRPVTVDTAGGTPYVTIAVGNNDRNAAYTSIDATNRIMTFSYTVVAADDDQDGVSISANSLALNGGTITDSVSSRAAVLTHAALADQSGHLVNRIPKVVTGGVAITSTPQATTDTYGLGETIAFSVTFDSVVEVDTTGGTPTLTVGFSEGGGNPVSKTLTYASGTGTATLVFEYTVLIDDMDDDGVAVAANQLALNSGTITHATTGQDANLTHAQPGTNGVFADHKVDGKLGADRAALSALALTGVTLAPSFDADTTTYVGTATAGTTQTTITATAETGTSITISPADAADGVDGHQVDVSQGTAITVTASADGKLTSAYTVTISFNAAVQSVAVSSDPGTDDTYAEGDAITVAVTFDRPVSVDTAAGTPYVTIAVGSNDRNAAYTSIDATNRILTFSYTVVAADDDQDGVSIGANSLALNGGSITDSVSSRAAVLTHAALSDQSGHLVNRIPKVVAGGVVITSTPQVTTDTYGLGETIAISVTFDSVVDVDTTGGTPTLTVGFSEGGGNPVSKTLAYTSGTGTATLVFEYTVLIDDVDDDGLAIEANQLALNSGTITHSTTGKDANLTHAQPGTNGVFADHKVNGKLGADRATLSALSLTGVTLAPAFDADTTTYVGTATTGTTQTTVTATAETGTSITISPADAEDGTDGHQVDVSQGTAITVTASAEGKITSTYTVTISFNAAVQSVAVSSDAGTDSTYAEGDAITVAVTVDRPVSVDTAAGTPYVTIGVGSNDRNAAYTSIDATNRIMTFSYTVVAADDDQDGVSISANALALNGGTITDSVSSRAAVLTHAALADQSGHLVNRIPLIVTDGVAIASTPQATTDTYGLGETIAFSVTFDSVVNVDTTGGTPTLTMGFSEGGGAAVSRTLAYASGTGTATLVFEYTVLIDDVDDDGVGMEANQLALNSGTITHSTTGKGAALTHARPGTNGVFADHKVNGKLGADRATLSALSLTSVTLAPAFDADKTTYVGTATTGTTQTTITATAETGTSITISPADAADGVDGHQVDVSQGTTITVTASADGKITSTYTVTISFNAAVQSVAVTSDAGTDATYAEGDAITVTVTFDRPVSVDTTGGTPYVTIAVGSNDRNAAYTSIDATNRIMTFSYTVVAADDDQDGVSISANALALNGGTITDSVSSRAAVLTHAALADQSGHLVNKIPKVVTGGVAITSTPQATTDTYGLGETIAISVTFDSVVNVDTTGGTPTLRMRLWHPGIRARDKEMAYASGSGTDTLVFEYVVQGEDMDNTGIVVSRNQLRRQGGTIKHASTGRNANLNHGQPVSDGTPSRHKVDGSIQLAALTTLSLSDVTLSPAFAYGTISYTATVGRGVTETTVSASADTGSTVVITPADADTNTDGHQVDLDRGANTIAVTVSKPGLTTRSYTVTVNRLWAEINRVSFTSNPGWDDTYATGDEIELSVRFDGPVSVGTTNGTPYVAFVSGAYNRQASYKSLDSSNRVLTFTYTVNLLDSSVAGLALGENGLALNGGSIKHLVTNEDALITHGALDPNPRHQVNKRPQIVSGGVKIASNPVSADGFYGEGETIRFRVEFDSLVVVNTDDGTPTLVVRIGDTDNPARDVGFSYSGGSGSASIEFEYTVQSGDRDSNGIYLGADRLRLNGGTIRHITTHRDATLDHAALETLASHDVDGSQAPTVLKLCGARLINKDARVDLCWELGSPIPTDADVVFELRRKDYFSASIKNLDTEDFGIWREAEPGDDYTGCGDTCIRFMQTLFSGRGGAWTYQARMRQGDTILQTSERLGVHVPNWDSAELDSELSGVYLPHRFANYPNEVATGIFRTDLTFTDPEVKFTTVELVSGLTASDFEVTNGTVTNIIIDQGGLYVITVMPTTLGVPVTIKLPQGRVHGVGSTITSDGRNTFTRPNNASNTLTVQTAEP